MQAAGISALPDNRELLGRTGLRRVPIAEGSFVPQVHDVMKKVSSPAMICVGLE